MTLGHIIFYAGLGLLGVTFVTALIFLLKRPKYDPKSIPVESFGDETVRLATAGTVTRSNLTASEGTVLLSGTDGSSGEGTVLLSETGESSGEGTVLLSETGEPSEEGTVLLTAENTSSTEETVLLSENEQ